MTITWMFVLEDSEAVRVCVVVFLGEGEFEMKSIATDPAHHGQGYGRMPIESVMKHYRPQLRQMLVGIGDSPLTVPFYKECGFHEYHRVKNLYG